MKAWREKADAVLDRPEPVEDDGELHHSQSLDGRWVTRGNSDALDGEIINTALRVATTEDPSLELKRTPSERRHDALTDICKFFLDNQDHRPGGRHRPHLNVV